MEKEVLTERKGDILKAIVETYIDTAQPVGSRALVQNYRYNFSPATVRHEMAALESLGYIAQPYTSAGRVPKDKGYRFYVDHLLRTKKINKLILSRLNREYHLQKATLEEIIKDTSKVLSSVTHHTAVVLAPQFVANKFNRIELVATGGKRVLLLLISNFGIIEDKFIQVEEEIFEEELRELNLLLNNRDKEFLKETLLGLSRRSKEGFTRLYSKAQKTLKEILKVKGQKKVYLDGTSFFLDEPEFKNREKIGLLLKSLEQEKTFNRLFKDTKADEVKVLIGQECGCKGMKDCSIVFASYRLGDEPIGTVGIIGPKRMDYQKVLVQVSTAAKRLTALVTDLAQ